jgi:succinyl-CoA synthetase beta subunit
MKIHEYQAKLLFREYDIPVPHGTVAKTTEEAVEAGKELLGHGPVVLKAQVHAGGRGKAGGIRTVHDQKGLEEEASGLLGSILVTAQTGAAGKPVNVLLLEEVIDIEREIYLGIVIDRGRGAPVVLTSGEGGMEIEKIAALSPEKVITEHVNPIVGLRPFQAKRIFYGLGLERPGLARQLPALILNLCRLFAEKDCSLAEINPLVITRQGGLAALDGKVALDDNALFRHPELSAMRDQTQENPFEVEASRYNLNYIKLKGNVGCMVNGAGLAMATMDLIKYAGAEPANFLDVGGAATSETVKQGFRILLSDPDVRVIFVNIFGGILRCDVLATGVVEAVKELSPDLPIVVRLEGTNVEEGRRILSASGLAFVVAADLGDAAVRVKKALTQSVVA